MDIFPIERKRKIMDLLNERPSVTVAELSGIFNVSEVTIRKDLKELDNEGHITRTHGGAAGITKMTFESVQSDKEKQNIEEKKAIAKIACALIQDGDSVMIDAGSTTQQLARCIKAEEKKITVITNSFNIASELMDLDFLELIIIGGIFRKGIYSCVGPIAESALEGLFVDKAFLGSNSMDLEHGFSTANIYEAQVKKKMIASSKERIFLVDHTKFNKQSLCSVCPLSALDYFITDSGAPAKYLASIRDKGVKVLVGGE